MQQSNDDSQVTNQESLTSHIIGVWAKAILWVALKSIALWFGWNLVFPTVLGVKYIDFGQAFVIVCLIRLLFTSLDPFSKFQTRHLFDMSNNLRVLIMNQLYQNNTNAFILKEIHDKMFDSDIEKIMTDSTSKTVDNEEETR